MVDAEIQVGGLLTIRLAGNLESWQPWAHVVHSTKQQEQIWLGRRCYAPGTVRISPRSPVMLTPWLVVERVPNVHVIVKGP